MRLRRPRLQPAAPRQWRGFVLAVVIAAAIGSSPLIADPPSKARLLAPEGTTAERAPLANPLRLLPPTDSAAADQPALPKKPRPHVAAADFAAVDFPESLRLVSNEQPIADAAVDDDDFFLITDGGLVGQTQQQVADEEAEAPLPRPSHIQPISAGKTPPSPPRAAFRVPLANDQPRTVPRQVHLAQAGNPFQDDSLIEQPLLSVGENQGPLEVLPSTGELTVTRRRSKILRAKNNIYRVAVVDPGVCDVVQFTPREVSVIGRGQGATNVTFWFEDGEHRPITYLVRVVPDPEIEDERVRQYQILSEILMELFPDSKVHLQPVADKLIVRGQAKDAAEAAQIMAVIRGEAVYGGPRGTNYYGGLVAGSAAPPISDEAAGNPLPAANIINMLQIPGVQQVALRVKIAELNRTAAREFGVDLDLNFDLGSDGALILQTMLNAASGSSTSIVGNFDNDRLNFGIHYLQQRGVVRLLSEPTLVTLSGRPASFIAGGEFAVPTTVGVGGAAAVTTDFRAFGVILNFLPVVLDKDRLRLEISPEFSSINAGLSVNGTPGLNTRAVTTTVEMREGQTLAIAGLLEETMDGDNTGDLPFLAQIFGKRQMSRSETELIILVSPELVHPMEPEATPPLPGFDVTEPTGTEFFLRGRLEGYPTREHRSTVWPRLNQRYRSGGTSMISGPFGHGQ